MINPLDLPKRTVALVIGPPQSEKEIFASQFLARGFQRNEHGIYLSTNKFPEEFVIQLQKTLRNSVEPFVQRGLISFIDCYSRSQSDDRDFIYSIGEPKALSKMSIAFSDILKNKSSPRVVIDSFSSLMVHNPLDMLTKFLEFQFFKLRKSNAKTIVLVEEGMHENKALRTLESLADAKIHFYGGYVLVSGIIEGESVNYECKFSDML